MQNEEGGGELGAAGPVHPRPAPADPDELAELVPAAPEASGTHR